MAGIGSVVVQFIAKDEMSKTVQRMGGKLRGFAKDTETGKRSWSQMAGIISGIAGGLGGIFVGVGIAAKNLADAALEDAQEFEKFKRVLSGLPGVTDKVIASTDDWIATMQLATLVSDTDLRSALGQLALATGDVTKAQDLLTVAVDTATARNVSLTSVTDQLSKAAGGNTAALKRQMPWLDKNRDGTLTFTEAVEGLTEAYSGSAAAVANRKPWERIGVIWGEIQEALGAYFLPALERLSDWFKSPANRRKIQDFIDQMGQIAYTVGEDVVDALIAFWKWLGTPEGRKALELIGGLLFKLDDAANAAAGALDAARWAYQRLVDLAKLSPIGLIVTAARGLTRSAPPQAGAAPPAQAGRAAPPQQVITINVRAADPWSTARELRRVLDRADMLVGRAPGQPVAPAW